MNNLHKAKRKKLEWNLFFIVLPFMVAVFLLSYVPILGWIIAFFDYRPGISLLDSEFLGLKYFMAVFRDKGILRSLKNTLIFSGIGYVLAPLPMLFAVCLNEIYHSKYRKFVQTATTIPHFISWVIVYSFVFALFSNEGLVNKVLMGAGIIETPMLPLQNENIVYAFQTFLGRWKELGWGAIIYIAAIAGIEQEQYEAARIDGAGRFNMARYITIPNLMPTFVTMLIMNVANLITTGTDRYLVFQNPFVYDKIEVLDVYVYRMGLQVGDYSYATAAGILKSFVSIGLLCIANYVAKKVRGSGIM